MKYWTDYNGHDPKIKGKIDNTIYSFDIETTSYLDLAGKQIPALDYLQLSEDEREASVPKATMYIWMLSVNEDVYYGRTWKEFVQFLDKLEENCKKRKIIFVHNLSFEFQFFCTQLKIKEVMSRTSRKVMTCTLADYNIQFRCSLYMTNVKLAKLPDIFGLTIKKMVGDLDYSKMRHSLTPLTDKELGYCEHDCLVIYEYIKTELLTYNRVDKIPITSTGKVRKELQKLVMKDMKYRRIVRESINTRPSVYNMLIEAFAGGYTHANYIYSDEVISNVDSYDETSAYPYVLVTHRFPSKVFSEANIAKVEDMDRQYAYLIRVTFYHIRCKYYNNFISSSKCNNIVNATYDNGRIIKADEISITLTDVDFRFICDTYDFDYYVIDQAYESLYNYLPDKYINFVLDKYVNKTQFKGVKGKELEYMKEKNKFNSLYGMTVTNMIRDDVFYDNEHGWYEKPLSDTNIFEKLLEEQKKSFLSFSWGVWCTAYARDNLLRRVIALDEHVVYCDTDSIKLVQGYDKSIFANYNKSVEDKIKYVANLLKIPYDRYCPADSKGRTHLLGVFECETDAGRNVTYDKFITQGAKKYAVEKDGNIEITVSGVPKSGAKCLKSLDEFRDDLVFDYKYTNKSTLMYNDNQSPFDLVDYNGVKYKVTDKSGVCLLPTTYKLGKALEYANLLTDNSSARAKFKKEI